MLNWLNFIKRKRMKRYREKYRALSPEDRQEFFNLLEHYSVFGGPINKRKMIEMSETAMEVDTEEEEAAEEIEPVQLDFPL